MSITGTFLRNAVDWRSGEGGVLAWSFAYFFSLLCGYYVLRPVRDEMGIAGGIENLPWVFTATFVAMLVAVPAFGAIASRHPRRRFVPWVYYFFIFNLIVFYALFYRFGHGAWVARAFFVWVSVYNLFVVSVFWSLMADVYSNAQARRLFGFIAAGGSAGAIAGPLLSAVLVTSVGTTQLLLLSATLLMLSVVCVHRVLAWARKQPRTEAAPDRHDDRPMGGSIWAGIRLVFTSPYLLGICVFVLLYSTLSTFLYFEQAHIVKRAFNDSAQRTQVFASIDLAVNVLTIAAQLFVAGRLMSRFPLAVALGVIPVAVMIGFAALALMPTLAVLLLFQIVRRAGNYAITRPAREVLFTVVDPQTKYKAKNFIDTVVYRGGDAASGWAFGLLKAAGLSLTAMAWIAVPLAALWLAVAVAVGRRHEQMQDRPPQR